jgi:hypothetical protein
MAKTVQRHGERSRKRVEAKRRSCLRCDKVFLSVGVQNRLCESCRQFLAAAPSPVEEHPLRSPSSSRSSSQAG